MPTPTTKAYLQLSNLTGDSTDEDHSGWFNVTSYTPVTGTSGGRSETVAFVIALPATGQSARLKGLCSAGTVVDKAVLEIYAPKTELTVSRLRARYEMSEVVVTGCQTGGTPPSDTITITFSRVWDKSPGKLQDQQAAGWRDSGPMSSAVTRAKQAAAVA